MKDRTSVAATGALFFSVSAMVFMPRLDQIQNGVLTESQLTDLRVQETMFVGFSLLGGILGSLGSNSSVPFVISSLVTFVVVAVYEGKASGYAFSQ